MENVIVAAPDVSHSREKIDFGRGFYVTPVYEQAVKWAERFKDAGDKAYLSVYDLDESVLAGLKVLDFPDHSGEWLDFLANSLGATAAVLIASTILLLLKRKHIQ